MDDKQIVKAINLVISEKGGVSLVNNKKVKVLPLPVAGLMSPLDGYLVADQYAQLDREAHKMGSTLRAPYRLWLCW